MNYELPSMTADDWLQRILRQVDEVRVAAQHLLATREREAIERDDRIAELEDEVKDLRQSLIGGVEGVKAGRDLKKWAKANDKYLRKPK